ncbi:MAG: OFA family MFS transporter [Desulfuromonadaceae bacterium]|nr:OFA family MFS transporter [Desulfuromonadaceae bacterium]
MTETVKNKGWTVTFAGLGINLALGILYAWSIFKAAIESSIKSGGPGAFNWDMAKVNDPYSVCCLVFAFAMILAGKTQDKFGPRATAFIGGLLVGIGLIWVSQSTSYITWVLGFGVLVGAGMGFGYSASTPPGLKWFPASKTGVIAGMIVAGFGLAPVYIAPLSGYLINAFGINQAMLVYGISFVGVVCGLSLLLVNPPAGYIPVETDKTSLKKKAALNDVDWKDAIKTADFWKLWAIFFVGSGAGLMVISSVAGLAKKSMGELAFIAVAIMAIGNAGGRVITGILSDKIGRYQTIMVVHLFQAVLMLFSIPLLGSQYTSAVTIVLLATLIGFNYGANLALFPAIAKDLWGIKAYGVNYGILFTSWGVGGFVLSKVSQMLKASTGSMTSSFVIAAILLCTSGMLTLTLGAKKETEKEEGFEGAFFNPGLGLTMADGGEKINPDEENKPV